MLLFLLLIIIAILLFGSAAVLGVIGVALGFIATLFAITTGIFIWESLSWSSRLIVLSPVIVLVAAVPIASVITYFSPTKRSQRKWLRIMDNAERIKRKQKKFDRSEVHARISRATNEWNLIVEEYERNSKR